MAAKNPLRLQNLEFHALRKSFVRLVFGADPYTGQLPRNGDVGGVSAEVCILVFKEYRPFAAHKHIFGPKSAYCPSPVRVLADLTDPVASPNQRASDQDSLTQPPPLEVKAPNLAAPT